MVVRLIEKTTRLMTYLKKSLQKRFLQKTSTFKQPLYQRSYQSVFRLLICLLLSWSLSSCAGQSRQIRLAELPDIPTGNEVKRLSGPISEVAPPAIFSDLADLLPNQQPQVMIASPKPDQVIEDTRLEVKLSVQNFSIYKDENVGLGPHIQLILDNQPARPIYSLEQPLTLENLAPGTHTLRAIAVQPWGESFKNETAYAQTTFHLFGKTGENAPDPDRPLLTLIEPQGSFGAEPLLLDYYLTNAPLHFLAQKLEDTQELEDTQKLEDEVLDWKVRGTVNGQDFVVDQWQPMYLKGFEPGQNWVQLTLIDEQGQPIENDFNSTIRVIDYDPSQRDALAKLTRGELPLQQVGQIVDLDYHPPVEVPILEQSGETESDRVEAEQIEPESEELEGEFDDQELNAEEIEALDQTEELEAEELEAEELEAETVEPKRIDTEEKPEGLDINADERTPAAINSEQLDFEKTEQTVVEGTEAIESQVKNSEIDDTNSDKPQSTEVTPKKKSLFEKFFGRKQSSPQAADPVIEQNGIEEVEEFEPPLFESSPEFETSAKIDDDTILVPAKETQLEPTIGSTEDAAISEGENAVSIPTELSAPSAPSDNLLAPESTAPDVDAAEFGSTNDGSLESKPVDVEPVDIEPTDVESTQTTTTKESIDSNLMEK